MTPLPTTDDVDGPAEDGSGHVLLRHPVPPALAGLVARISGYRETVRRPIRMPHLPSITCTYAVAGNLRSFVHTRSTRK